MNAVRKYGWIMLTSIRSNLAYLGEVAGRIVFLGVILYIFMRLWQVTYGQMGTDKLGGFTITQMLWYLTITESITLSCPRIAPGVDEDVRTGAFAITLLRPLSYPVMHFWSTSGERLVKFAMNIAAGSLIAWMLVGPLTLEPLSVLALLLALPCAFLLEFLAYFLIGLGAFWLEDTQGLVLIYSRLAMILGGMLIPLELFPEGWQPVLAALPFSSMVYGPARMFIKPDLEGLFHVVGIQLSWIVLLGAAVSLLYRRALKHVYANGG